MKKETVGIKESLVVAVMENGSVNFNLIAESVNRSK
jgi:hypothetical protein